ncbi:MAG: hypothetical protein WD205_09120, partial [Rhodothermales bacterium]
MGAIGYGYAPMTIAREWLPTAMFAMVLAMLLVVLVPATAAAQSGDMVGGLARELRQGGLEGLVGVTGEGVSGADASVYAFEY